jgi:hypothetical protein
LRIGGVQYSWGVRPGFRIHARRGIPAEEENAMRNVVFGFLAVAILIGTGDVANAQKKKQKKANAPVTGKIFSIDEDKGFIRLLVTTRNKKETSTTDPLFKIDEDTKIVTAKKEFTGMAGLKELKKDDMVTVQMDEDLKVISVTVGGGGGKK